MSEIERYLEEIDRLITQIPYRLSTRIDIENRGDVVLYLRGEIVFTDTSELHFKEYFIVVPALKKLAYLYHYQNKDKEMIFRFDNAEHHPEVRTYPHHKHMRDTVLPSTEMSLKDAITEAINSLMKGL